MVTGLTMHRRLRRSRDPYPAATSGISSIGALLPGLSSHFQRLGHLVKSA
jgi:hypothetical protein